MQPTASMATGMDTRQLTWIAGVCAAMVTVLLLTAHSGRANVTPETIDNHFSPSVEFYCLHAQFSENSKGGTTGFCNKCDFKVAQRLIQRGIKAHAERRHALAPHQKLTVFTVGTNDGSDLRTIVDAPWYLSLIHISEPTRPY